MKAQVVLKCLTFIFGAGICTARKNVLFLVADDLRPQLNAYSGEYFPSPVSPPMITPNIDQLARESLFLQRAYVQQAMCSPSRASFLTGRRPDTTHVYNLKSYFRDVGGNFTTIPQYFKQQGYRTFGMGKIFHPGEASNNNDPLSWTEPYFDGKANHENKSHSWKAVPETDLVRRPLRDRQVAAKAIEAIYNVSKTPNDNFFIAVGFHKPHVPFVFPESFLDFYPEDSINLPDNEYAPLDMPDVAWTTYSTLREYHDIEYYNITGEIGTLLPASVVIELRRAYYAAVTWIDSLVGEILNELEDQGLSNNTIVSFIGDHGYQLGEHGEWEKRTNFELATHAPMMIRIPGLTDNGITSEQLVEFVDLFPTIVEAAGLGTIPQCPEPSEATELCHEGMSLMPLVSDPENPLKNAVFSQTPSPYPNSGRIMGYTMRTERYRYTEWVTFRYDPFYEPNWNLPLSGVELYDYDDDPYENVNRANDIAYKNVREQLRKQLRNGWTDAKIENPTKKRLLEKLISWLTD